MLFRSAFGLLQEAVFPTSHSGPNGSTLLLAVSVKPKAIAAFLFKQSAQLHAVRPIGVFPPFYSRLFALYSIAQCPSGTCDKVVSRPFKFAPGFNAAAHHPAFVSLFSRLTPDMNFMPCNVFAAPARVLHQWLR